jgi:hypothetical protein
VIILIPIFDLSKGAAKSIFRKYTVYNSKPIFDFSIGEAKSIFRK